MKTKYIECFDWKGDIDNPWKCPKCDKRFTSVKKLKAHDWEDHSY